MNSKIQIDKKPTTRGFLGTLLASIGVTLLMKALTGSGNKPKKGRGLHVEPFGFVGQGLHVDPFLPTNTRNVFVPKTGRG